MIPPSKVTNAVYTALQSMGPLTTLLGEDLPDPSLPRLYAYHYEYGDDFPLSKAVYKMPRPGVLIAYDRTAGGNFDGSTIWKHSVGIYMRGGNSATSLLPVGVEDLWDVLMNAPVLGTELNIRSLQLLPNLEIMETPNYDHRTDEDKMDYFTSVFTFGEIGDEGNINF